MNLEISTDQLRADTSTMSEQIEALDAARDKVISCLNNLNSMWDGAANAAFVRQVFSDNLMLTRMISNLRNLVECLEYAHSEYVHCDEEVKQKIASLRMSGDT